MNILAAIIITILSAIIGATGTFFLKLSSKRFGFNLDGSLFNLPLILGLAFHGGASLIFITALKYAPLSLLYPFAALSYVWAAVLSVKYLNEKMTGWKWLGIVFILIGLSLIGLGSS